MGFTPGIIRLMPLRFLPLPEDRGVLVDNSISQWPVPENSPPVPVVVLEHSIPDEQGGTVHWDLLVARGWAGDALLWGLRCMERPDGAGRAIVIEAMPDHRSAWLTREGEVSGGRGVVRRVASGFLERRAGAAHVKWNDGRVSHWRIAGSCLHCE